MKNMSVRRPGVIWYDCLHYSPEHLSNPDAIRRQIQQDSQDSDIGNLEQYKIILDFRCEGQCDRTIAQLVGILKTICQDILVIFSTVIDVACLPYKAVSVPEAMANHMNWFDLIDRQIYDDRVDKKFLCLMRRPSHSRAEIARYLSGLSSVRMSFGSMARSEELKQYQIYLPDQDLPLLLDGFIDRDQRVKEHDQRDPIFHANAFNIIAESSSQTDVNIWTSVFITEKTYKAFALRQIPIWFAVPSLVDAVRHLGFDLFDDIVDHSYDQTVDQSQRFQQVFQVLKDLDRRYDLTQCQNLRRSLRDRLDYNYDLVRSCEVNHETKIQKVLEEFYAD